MSLTKYHCNFLQDDRLIDATPIDGVDDAAALIEADKILGESAYSSIELWEGARMVAIVSRHIGGSGIGKAQAQLAEVTPDEWKQRAPRTPRRTGSSPAGQLLELNQTYCRSA